MLSFRDMPSGSAYAVIPMTGRILRLLPMLLLLALAACGGTKVVTITETKTVTVTAPAPTIDTLPPIVVDSPHPGDAVRTPLRVTGTADTFEATFDYDLLDESGKVISHHFETATSGSGTRGTFDFEIPFHVDRAQAGTLVLYEISAADGSRIHEVRVPIRLEP
jgi:Immunoglobulin-like domain of bacterial spore germination